MKEGPSVKMEKYIEGLSYVLLQVPEMYRHQGNSLEKNISTGLFKTILCASTIIKKYVTLVFASITSVTSYFQIKPLRYNLVLLLN